MTNYITGFREIVETIGQTVPVVMMVATGAAILAVVMPWYMRSLIKLIEGRNERQQRLKNEALDSFSTGNNRFRDFFEKVNEDPDLGKVNTDSIYKFNKYKDFIKNSINYRAIQKLIATNKNLTEALERQEETSHRDKHGKPKGDWRDALISLITRLSRESDRLKGKSTINLVLGVMFSSISVLALVILLLIYTPSSSNSDTAQSIINYLPRFAIAAILQVVAIFFLRLHALIEGEIKNNKNEITNIELKLAAALLEIENTNMKNMSEIWSRDERNFVINKNQKVASNIDIPDIRNFIDVIRRIESNRSK